jgi:hypothetical protein
LCTVGSTLENLNPALRQQRVQALDQVMYAKEKYEKLVRAKRKKVQREAEQARKKEERRKRKESRHAKQLEVKRRRLSFVNEGIVPGNEDQREFLNFELEYTFEFSAQFDTLTIRNQEYEPTFQQNGNHYGGVENETDYFGAPPDEYYAAADDQLMDENDEQYDLVALIEREINEIINDNDIPDNEVDDELPKEINIFATRESIDELHMQDVVLGDQVHSISMSELQNSYKLGTFATNDPSFFNLDKLADLFARTNFESIKDDQDLLKIIQK